MSGESRGKGKNRHERPPKADDDENDGGAMVHRRSLSLRASSGPIPPPETMRAYEDCLPGAADRIIAMAERESEHRHGFESKVLEARIEDDRAARRQKRRGQYFGLTIGLVGLVAACIVTIQGYPWVGGTVGGSVLLGLVSTFVVGRRAGVSEEEKRS